MKDSHSLKDRRKYLKILVIDTTVETSVADPDPKSGIRSLFDPWIRDRFFRTTIFSPSYLVGVVGSGINILDPQY
jgi:hypothetical protein